MSESKDKIKTLKDKVIENIFTNKDMVACLAAGVDTEWSTQDNEDGTTTIKLTTKNPVAVKEINGKTVVFERV